MTMQPRTWSSSATSASRTTLWNHCGKSSARVGLIPAACFLAIALPCPVNLCAPDGSPVQILAHRAALGLPPPLRPRPLRAAAAPDAPWAAPAAVDDPERDRLPAPRRDPGVP